MLQDTLVKIRIDYRVLILKTHYKNNECAGVTVRKLAQLLDVEKLLLHQQY